MKATKAVYKGWKLFSGAVPTLGHADNVVLFSGECCPVPGALMPFGPAAAKEPGLNHVL
jgi:hypothetical protein